MSSLIERQAAIDALAEWHDEAITNRLNNLPSAQPEPEPDPPPKASRAKKQLEEAEKNFQKRKIGDIGKLRFLRAAGWDVKKIATEFGCSEATVYNTMKREGIE